MSLEDLETRLTSLEERFELCKEAFPQLNTGTPDLSGHRNYHERKIEAARAEADFWRDLKYDLTKKGIWFGFIIVLGFVISGIIYTLKQKLGGLP